MALPKSRAVIMRPASSAAAGGGALAVGAGGEEGGGAGDFLDGLAEVEGLHHAAGFVGVLGERAVVKVGDQRGKSGVGVALRDGLDLLVDSPPLLEDHD